MIKILFYRFGLKNSGSIPPLSPVLMDIVGKGSTVLLIWETDEAGKVSNAMQITDFTEITNYTGFPDSSFYVTS